MKDLTCETVKLWAALVTARPYVVDAHNLSPIEARREEIKRALRGVDAAIDSAERMLKEGSRAEKAEGVRDTSTVRLAQALQAYMLTIARFQRTVNPEEWESHGDWETLHRHGAEALRSAGYPA